MNSFNVHTKIMTGGGLETVAPKLKRAFIVTDGFMSSSGKVSYITDMQTKAIVEEKAKCKKSFGKMMKALFRMSKA